MALTVLTTSLGLFSPVHSQATLTWLGTLGGNFSEAHAASFDGSVVVGAAMLSNNQYRPFRWTQDTGLVQLQFISGDDAGARNVSLDGRVVIGISSELNVGYRAVRWTPPAYSASKALAHCLEVISGTDSAMRGASR